ncbi:hypothetical protein B0J14DRAFT_622151 [Halenospora varia]|nr:hypothetical protein B0J14DRAFT_622151 [Halenospora varia]
MSLLATNMLPDSPGLLPVVTLNNEQATEIANAIIEVLKSTNTKQAPPPPPIEPLGAKESKARALTLEFKKDKAVYKYKIVESITPPDKEDKFDEYIFVVRTRIDRKTQNQIHYIDIKSPGLQDVLREVLQDVDRICLQEEKPSVEQNLLYHYLLDLEKYRKSGGAARDSSTLDHLDLLRLGPLLKKHQIIYDLLWTLFKPNSLAYTKCFGTSQPRCVKYKFGEEKTTKGGVEYFYIKACYLDFDRKKFRRAKRITALEVFPLKYHLGEKHKFLSIMDVHLCKYKGKAFYIKKEQVVKIYIKSQVMILFDLAEVCEKSLSLAKGNGMDPLEVKGDDLLIYSLTVPRFSLGNRRWAALDDLHIPPKKKKAVQALSEAHIRRASTNPFDDVIEGKGQGFNVLLYGPLGVDKADVLLKQRLVQDIYQNALVCVFLRTLEYYQGMMFLTTNRVEQIDDAIASRIHFKLKYDNLNQDYSNNDFESWIKNLVTMSHLEVAIDVCDDFKCDFKGTGSKEAINGYF